VPLTIEGDRQRRGDRRGEEREQDVGSVGKHYVWCSIRSSPRRHGATSCRVPVDIPKATPCPDQVHKEARKRQEFDYSKEYTRKYSSLIGFYQCKILFALHEASKRTTILIYCNYTKSNINCQYKK
jgi:hypothetical protein